MVRLIDWFAIQEIRKCGVQGLKRRIEYFHCSKKSTPVNDILQATFITINFVSKIFKADLKQMQAILFDIKFEK